MGVEELEDAPLVPFGKDALEEGGVAGDADDVLQAAAARAVQEGLEVRATASARSM
jgi:hypothetical protein